MQQIWAPWRIEYICSEDKSSEGACFLCEAIESEETEDEEHYLLYRGERCFCILNRYPYNNGHLMIVPNRHEGELVELTDDEILELMKLTQKAQSALVSVMNPDGFNFGANLGKVAGAGVEDHFHLHLVPRWQGDTSFMPVIGDVKVIPQALRDLYKQLKSELNEIQ